MSQGGVEAMDPEPLPGAAASEQRATRCILVLLGSC